MDLEMKMNKIGFVLMMLLLCCSAAWASDGSEPLFSYHFATREEGIGLLMSETDYFRNMSQADLDFRLRKNGAAPEELLAAAPDQIMDFTEEEMARVSGIMDEIEAEIREKGYHLPELDEITFVKSDMSLEMEAGGYTHKTHIFLSKIVLAYPPEKDYYVKELVCHELFHCITRSSREFREKMYKIIGFTLNDTDYEPGELLRSILLSNPDVEHHDAHGLFTAYGEARDFFVVSVFTEPFSESIENPFRETDILFIPVSDPDDYYTKEEISDFWDHFGKNTLYVMDPEECLADNFAFVLTFGPEGRDGSAWPSPEIIDQIIAVLQD